MGDYFSPRENSPLGTLSCVDEGAFFESSEEDLIFGTQYWGKTFPWVFPVSAMLGEGTFLACLSAMQWGVPFLIASSQPWVWSCFLDSVSKLYKGKHFHGCFTLPWGGGSSLDALSSTWRGGFYLSALSEWRQGGYIPKDLYLSGVKGGAFPSVFALSPRQMDSPLGSTALIPEGGFPEPQKSSAIHGVIAQLLQQDLDLNPFGKGIFLLSSL